MTFANRIPLTDNEIDALTKAYWANFPIAEPGAPVPEAASPIVTAPTP